MRIQLNTLSSTYQPINFLQATLIKQYWTHFEIYIQRQNNKYTKGV